MLSMEKRIKTKQQLKEVLLMEKAKYPCKFRFIGYLLGIRENAILYRHAVLLRKAEYHHNVGHKLRAVWYKALLRHLQLKYSLLIPLNTCECGLKIMHLGPILINKNSSVGKNCSFHIYTALVAKGTTDETPILGEQIVVGIGAKIVGGVHIANKVAIGANAVVTKDILEENITIGGIPAKKISNSGSFTWNVKSKCNLEKITC